MPDRDHFPPADPRNLVVNVLRTDDLLALQFEFVNLHLDTRANQEARLARTQFGQPAFIKVRFPPQHVAEQAFPLDAGGPPPDPIPVKALFSGPSRLVFKLPDEVESIPYTLDSFLDWAKLEPEVAPNALPPEATDGPGIMPLDETVTAMELPFRLFLSSDKFGRWAHKVQPQTFNGRTELWHTRLGTYDSNHLRHWVHLDVIRFKYEHRNELGAPSPRSVQDVEFAKLREAVLRAYNERHGEAVRDFQRLLRRQEVPDGPEPDPASATMLALLRVGIDFSVPEADLRGWLNDRENTPYPALAEALLKLLEGDHLGDGSTRHRVHLDVIRFKYEEELGAPSPRSVQDVDLDKLREAVLRAYNERHGEAVRDFQRLLRRQEVPDGPEPDPASATMLALLRVGIDFSVPEADLRGWLNDRENTPYPALAEALLKLLEGMREAGASLRAIGFHDEQDLFRTSLRNDQLREIVGLSSDFSIRPHRPPGLDDEQWRQMLQQQSLPEHYVPRAIEVERLMLTSLGAWARLQGAWDYPTVDRETLDRFQMPQFSLEQWQHIATMGRDQYVQTVEKGFLCPIGHRASYVTVTERRFEPIEIATEPTPTGPVPVFGAIAYLRQYAFIIVQEPEKDYGSLSEAYEYQGREMPFRRIRLTTLVTPKLDQSVSERIVAKLPSWIQADNKDIEFGVVAEDWDGRQVTLSMPLVFVPIEALGEPGAIKEKYNEPGVPPLRHQRPLNSQVVAFAPGSGESNTTRLKMEQVTFDAEFEPQLKVNNLPPTYPPRFLPYVKGAKVNIPAVDQLLGRAGAVEIGFHEQYLNEGMGSPANASEVFAKFQAQPDADPALPLAFSTAEAGGLAKPDMNIDGLSRMLGPVPNVDAVKNMTFDASVFAGAQLLGGITLEDVLPRTTFVPEDFRPANLTPETLDDANVHIKVPMLTTRPIYAPGVDPADPLAKPEAVETRYLWKPEIQDTPPPPADALLKTKKGEDENGFPDTAAQLILEATKLTPIDGRPIDGPAPGSRVRGRLMHFALNFAGVLKVKFEELSFLSEQGKKPDVSAEGIELEFGGPLAFVNTLKDILPANGFSDPPSVAVRPDGIVAGYSLGVPSVGVGIFSIQNIALSASLSVPFTEKPAGVRFALSERHHPFTITVSLFGGGGFFALAAGAKGIEQVEAALEFGGNVSLNLGVASGGVYVMAGIYFNMAGESVELSGYLRCGGHLEVLGLICVSVEFFMSLSYRTKDGGGGEAWGQASLTVRVKVLFFSKSVSLTVERRFAGAAGDPSFDELVEPNDWEEYCSAFA